MKAGAQILDKKSHSIKVEDPKAPYKVYVGFEKDGQGDIANLEVIDGYIAHNERLILKKSEHLSNGISYFELEIVPNSQMNTYLKIPVANTLLNSILVKVFKQGNLLGTQWVDKEGNILS